MKKQQKNTRNRQKTIHKNNTQLRWWTIFILGILLVTPVLVSAITWDDLSLNDGLVSYYDFNTGSGIVVEDKKTSTHNGIIYSGIETPVWKTSGKLNGAINTNYGWINISDSPALSGLTESTISFWMKYHNGYTNTPFVIKSYSGDEEWSLTLVGNELIFWETDQDASTRYTRNTSSAILKNGSWHNVVIATNATEGRIWINGKSTYPISSVGTIANRRDSSQQLVIGGGVSAQAGYSGKMNITFDEFGVWNITLTAAQIEGLYNNNNALEFSDMSISGITVTLFSPENQTTFGVNEINFTANVSVVNFALKNSTFNVWFTNGTLFNQTTRIMQPTNNTNLTISNFVLGNYIWNVKVCGENATATQCSWSTNNFTFEIGAMIDSFSFPINVSETQRARFIVNISLLSGANLFAARLNYNGTKYLATKTLTNGNQYRLSRNIDIPILSGSKGQNLTFFWEFEYKNGAQVNQNSQEFSHSVNPLIFHICNASQPTKFWNITMANESSRTKINGKMDATFRYWLGAGTVIKNYTLDSTQEENNYTFCANRGTLNVSSIINVKSISFYERTFYFNKEKLSNSTTNTTLYLQGGGSPIILQVTDPGLVPKIGTFVNVFRYFPEINEYLIVEKAKTDEFGQFVARLIEPNTVKYQFEFLNSDNNILKRTDDITIACRTSICIIPFVIEGDFTDFDRFINVSDFDYTLSFSNSTNIFTYTWNDVTGSSISSRLLVERIAFNGTTTVCNSTSTSSANTMTCSVGSSKAKYRAQAFRKVSGDSEGRVVVLNIEVGSTVGTFGLEGLFWAFMLLFTLVGVGSFNPSVGVILYTIGFIALGALSIISMPIPIFFANLALGILFVWSIRT